MKYNNINGNNNNKIEFGSGVEAIMCVVLGRIAAMFAAEFERWWVV